MIELFLLASKNLVGPGHPRPSARHCRLYEYQESVVDSENLDYLYTFMYVGLGLCISLCVSVWAYDCRACVYYSCASCVCMIACMSLCFALMDAAINGKVRYRNLGEQQKGVR